MLVVLASCETVSDPAPDTRRDAAADSGSIDVVPDQVIGDSLVADLAPDAADLSPAQSEWNTPLGGGITVGELASHYAPLYYQDTDTGGPDAQGAKQDYFTTVDYDGDLQHNNNWDNLAAAQISAQVYYGLTATKTHTFIVYSSYYPRDWASICTGLFTECHEGDMESLVLVVQQTSSPYGKPVLLISRAHGVFYAWSNDPGQVTGKQLSIDGALDWADSAGTGYSKTYSATHSHVRVYAQDHGHGTIPCRAAESPPLLGYVGFGATGKGIYCVPGAAWDAGFQNNDGLIVRFARGQAEQYQGWMSGGMKSVTYDLVGQLNTLFAWRGQVGTGKVFRDLDALLYQGGRGPPFLFGGKIGIRFDAEQFINDLSSGTAPWGLQLKGSQTGDLFLDPAFAVGEAFSFGHPFSKDYTHNPYVPGSVGP